MKTRIISAIIALLICIPIIYFGGNVYFVAVSLIGLIGFNEILNFKKDLPIVIKLISMISFILLLINNLFTIPYLLNIEDKLLIILLLNILPIIYYNKTKKYNIEDAFYLLGVELLLGLSFNALVSTRLQGLEMFIVLISITIITDTFALFSGMLFGKHKLAPSVSPNKTIEGFIGGLIFGTLISTILYVVLVNGDKNIVQITLFMALLSVIGQVGDLVFSCIKRHYKIKDFGNIMPGHGGVLDRLDSMLFVMLTFSYLSRLL